MQHGNRNLSLTKHFSAPHFSPEQRALFAIARREWLIFKRYPSWIVAVLIWPVIFPAVYILERACPGRS